MLHLRVMADCDFEFKDSVCISGGGMHHRVIIPFTHIKTIDGRRFMHLSAVPHFASTLFGCARNNTVAKTDRPLSNTDIIQRLTDIRNSKIDNAISEISTPRGGHRLGKHMPSKRLTTAVRMQIPSAMEIVAPDVGTVAGITMRVMTSHKRSPLYMELVSDNVKYVLAVCMAQIESGDVKRYRTPIGLSKRIKKRRSKPQPEHDDNINDESTTIDGPQPSAECSSPDRTSDVATPEKTVVKRKCVKSTITRFFKAAKYA